MKAIKNLIFLLQIILIVNLIHCQNKKPPLYKCEHYEEEKINPLPNHIVENPKRRMDDVDEDGFKEFNIYFDLENIKNDIKTNGLEEHEEFFIRSIEKAVSTLKSLLRVKPLENNYVIFEEDFEKLNISKWDTSKINEETGLKTQGIDLAIFGSIENLGSDQTLATATARAFDQPSGQPYIGVVKINKNINYSLKNSEYYFQAILVHEFTHILGFSKYFFEKFHKDYYILKTDKNGIQRSYLSTPKLMEVAKKYFNCPTMEGVELENQGGSGTADSHWEARILLGEYMNGYSYTEEQVISEFTLAYLEDTGYYKPNYYTGGLMRFGKHKGCEFLEEMCVDKTTHKINPKFENEFFDSLYGSIDPSCSSGRLSRTYKIMYESVDVPEEYQYFKNEEYFPLYEPADFCPVNTKYEEEELKSYYVGHCSKVGTDLYGTLINYGIPSTDSTSKSFAPITGEELSDNSFCFISSLIISNHETADYKSNFYRANCHKILCSERSLTIKIFDDYVVCPRQGGKIKVEGYKGYLLCPDYNLMCSGSVICNEMFDCIDKKSEIKDKNYEYDYEIKTSQNITKAKSSVIDDENNYELSTDGICPKNCKQCKENNKCLRCRNNYGLFQENNENEILCVDKSLLTENYYENENGIYMKCIDNCKICSDSDSCNECMEGFYYSSKKCIKVDNPIDNCSEYDENMKCKKCKQNYGLKEADTTHCYEIEAEFGEYYTKDEVSYYPCENEVLNCSKCFYVKETNEIKCEKCKDNYLILNEICTPKEQIEDANNTYYFINETHVEECSQGIINCVKCLNKSTCIECKERYYFNTTTFECLEKTEHSLESGIHNFGNYLLISNAIKLQAIFILLLLIKF